MKEFILNVWLFITSIFGYEQPVEVVEIPIEAKPVSVYHRLHLDNTQLECLALNVYFEARNQSRDGQMAVAMVVLNRAEDSFWPGNICDVIKQGSYTTGRVSRHQCQFSWYCDGLSDRPKEHTTWNTILNVARESYYAWDIGYDITFGATNYHSDKVRPEWRKDRGMTFLTTIDNHHFYEWKREKGVAFN